MSEKTYFQIYFGEGEIRYGQFGVDLSGFRSVTKGLDRTTERSFRSVYNWFMKCFKLDDNECELRISAVTTRSSSHVYWELVSIDNAPSGRGLLMLARGVAYEKENVEGENAQAYDEATVVEQVVENNVNELNEIGVDEQGERSETVREPKGEVDQGEEIPGLVEQMQREDTEADVRVDEDSDHEDDTLNQVPSQWTNYDHSQPMVNEGAIYHSKIELKEAVQRWSVKCLRKEFRVVKSSPQVYDVKCIRDDCPFRFQELNTIHASLKSLRVSTIVNNPEYEPKAIINSIDDDFQYKISYSKAYRAKQNALKMRWGTYEASYHNLPRVLNTSGIPNPTKRVLQRAFFILGTCINAFQYCRPVICIDGTFLTGRYKGTMLTAIAADGNNQKESSHVLFRIGEMSVSFMIGMAALCKQCKIYRSDPYNVNEHRSGLI
ncbi:hypothetical protein U9M48_044097 [Paspalum notatum var. saurae]|uniref:Transposase MuDR plant domain-containing protein n=1 Tax=Paspalum notatum var. saurae TaxID=547442 RepID=A0AAQ3XJ85_PASNO